MEVGQTFDNYPLNFLTFHIHRTMQLQNVLFVVGAVVLALAFDLTTIYAGRFIVGMGCALSAAADVPYLHEIAPCEYRGRLSSMFEIMVVFGALLGSLSGLVFASTNNGWRIMFIVPCVISALQALALFTLPESPKWLMDHNRSGEALEALKGVYGDNHELLRTVANSMAAQAMESKCRIHLFKEMTYKYRVPLAVMCVLMALGLLTGSVALRNYAPTIFEEAGFNQSKALILNLVVSVVNVIVVVCSSAYVDKLGRKLLLTVGFSVAGVGMLGLALGFAFSQSNNIALFLLCGILTSAGFNMGFGPVGWILSSEMFPVAIRGRALSLLFIVRNSFEFLTNFLFLTSVDQVHADGTFFIFATFCGISLLFVRLCLVETKELEPNYILKMLNARFCVAGEEESDEDRLSQHTQNVLLEGVVMSDENSYRMTE